jgi:hypothetical protein
MDTVAVAEQEALVFLNRNWISVEKQVGSTGDGS